MHVAMHLSYMLMLCLPCSKLVADDVSCFEPEAGAYLVEGLDFHKFYFSNGLCICY